MTESTLTLCQSRLYPPVRDSVLARRGLYCKRPIQCLASSEILTPHPLTTRRVCTLPPPPLVRGEYTLAGWRGGGGVNISEDARYCSVLYICKYFCGLSFGDSRENQWERVWAQRNQSALRSPGVEDGSDRKRADFHTV
jgi:hypothetical protein